MFTYIVTISDINPMYSGGGNKMVYRFPNQRKAFRFMADAMSRGFYVTVYSEPVNMEEVRHGW